LTLRPAFGPDDPRYRAVTERQFNRRFRAAPDYVRPVGSTAEAIVAVETALREGRRLAVTSGGHCLEGFVSDPEVRALLDLSPMRRIGWDPERRAVEVEAGATVGDVFRALHERWGTVLPLGEYPAIGMGGHVVGGAFGFLCRQLGLAADYLHAVEVVTVDRTGRASSVIAGREPDDPHRELWWAHTGGGGGNFGVVTRYWFRSPDAGGDDPRISLPRAPASVTTFRTELRWSDLDRAAFLRLLRNHGEWCERSSGPDAPAAELWALLEVHRRQLGTIVVRGVSTAASPEPLVREHLSALTEGTGVRPAPELVRMSWLDFALDPFPDLFAAPPGGVSVKVKDALLRQRLGDAQLEIAWDYLTREDYDVMGGMLGLATYGGSVNRVPRDATASAQRGAMLDMACTTGWLDPAEAERNLAWVRAFYRDLFGTTGGAPIPGEAYEGALINHPDTDLADPAWNRSGVPWHAIYYHDNYPRLQRIKARSDPGDVFRHALSVRPA
jgi:FAD/FMN-containing dehydrogenase